MSDTLKFELSKCASPTSSIELNRAAAQAIVDEIADLERRLSEAVKEVEHWKRMTGKARQRVDDLDYGIRAGEAENELWHQISQILVPAQNDPYKGLIEAAEAVVAQRDASAAYAEELAAPARELLRLYDLRPQLAKEEEIYGKDPRTYPKALKKDLREYGEQKKAGWIALRAALEKLVHLSIPSVAATLAQAVENVRPTVERERKAEQPSAETMSMVLRAGSVIRMASSLDAPDDLRHRLVEVGFSRRPTDDELHAFHAHVRQFNPELNGVGNSDPLPCKVYCEAGPAFGAGVPISTLLGYFKRREKYNADDPLKHTCGLPEREWSREGPSKDCPLCKARADFRDLRGLIERTSTPSQGTDQ